MAQERMYYRKLIDLKYDIERRALITQPDYQRQFCWDRTRKSRLIESVMLNRPVNPLHFAESKQHVNEVIDGLQRLTTFVHFIDNKFSLHGLKKLTQYEKMKFKDLPDPVQMQILHYQIPIFPYPEEAENPRLKFEIFESLNIGSTVLTAHELRNCVFAGSYVNLINRLAATQSFIDLLNMQTKRMKDRELILAFFVMQNYTPETNYRTSFKDMLDTELQENVNLPAYEVRDKEQLFYKFLEICGIIFKDSRAFRKRPLNGMCVFNEDIYRACCAVLPQYDVNKIREHAEPIQKAIKQLIENPAFANIDIDMDFVRVHPRAKMLKETIDKVINQDFSEGDAT